MEIYLRFITSGLRLKQDVVASRNKDLVLQSGSLNMWLLRKDNSVAAIAEPFTHEIMSHLPLKTHTIRADGSNLKVRA